MFFFNPYSIPFFIVSAILILLGIYVPIRVHETKFKAPFFIWCWSAFIWQFSYALCFSSRNESLSLFLARLGAASVFLLPSAYHFFVANFINSEKEKKISYGFLFFFSLLALSVLFTDKLIVGVYKYYFGFHGRGSFLYLISVGMFLIPIGWTLHVFIDYFRDKQIELKKRKQARYIFISYIAAALASFDFLPKFGIVYYPKGWFFFSIWVVAISYAILAHNLLDIKIVIKKGFVYSIAVAFMTAIYSILVIVAGKIFQGFIGYQSFFINLFAVFVIAILFNPLRDIIQHVLDKRYFHGTLESLDQDRERLQQELFHKEKLAYVGQMASSIVHEIRNPLTAIKTHLDYLPQKYQDVEFRQKFNALIPKEVERIEKVLGQLLNLAKPRQVDLRPVNVCALIDSTLTLLEDSFTLKKISIKRNYQAPDVLIQGDEEQLKQVFLNLFLNAIQAMGEGGELSIAASLVARGPSLVSSHELQVPRHERRETRDEKRVQITIADTGCGISEENLKKLFEPFHTTKRDGIGLGLSITQEIINLHGGTIAAESKLGEGTKFKIELPRA